MIASAVLAAAQLCWQAPAVGFMFQPREQVPVKLQLLQPGDDGQITALVEVQAPHRLTGQGLRVTLDELDKCPVQDPPRAAGPR